MEVNRGKPFWSITNLDIITSVRINKTLSDCHLLSWVITNQHLFSLISLSLQLRWQTTFLNRRIISLLLPGRSPHRLKILTATCCDSNTNSRTPSVISGRHVQLINTGLWYKCSSLLKLKPNTSSIKNYQPHKWS